MIQATQEADKAKEQLKKIVDLFSSQQLVCTYKKAYLLGNERPSSKWSIGNKIIMMINGTDDARTYLEWQKAGRYVKKGSKGFWILAPNTFSYKVKDPVTGEEKKITELKGFRISKYAEFRKEDTEGKEIEYIQKPKQPPNLIEVAERLGVKVSYDLSKHGEYGSYSPSTSEIVLASPDESVFFHELAHHAHKLIEGNLKGGQDLVQEAIAELTACVLASMYGRDVKSLTYTYIAHYAQNKTTEAVSRICLQVMNTVEKILDLIFSAEEKKA